MQGGEKGHKLSLETSKLLKEVGQQKSHSVIESLFNVLIGFGISMVANMIVLPWFGFKVSLSSAFGIGVIFTLISIVRSYLLRRLFNRIMLWAK